MSNDVEVVRELESVEKSEDKSMEYTIRLSMLVKLVLDLKVLAMYPSSENMARDKLYNLLSVLEDMLVQLKNVNVELKRDWWNE